MDEDALLAANAAYYRAFAKRDLAALRRPVTRCVGARRLKRTAAGLLGRGLCSAANVQTLL